VIGEALLVIRGGDGDLARAQAAMSAGEGAGAHAGQLEGNDVVAEEGDDPADGTDKRGPPLPVQYMVLGSTG
jgi:hypothetical protein